MIYNVEAPLFQSFLSSGKHKPTSEEIIDALADISKKHPGSRPEQHAAMLRGKRGAARVWGRGGFPRRASGGAAPRRARREYSRRGDPRRIAFSDRDDRTERATPARYPQWVLDDVNWAALSDLVPEQTS